MEYYLNQPPRTYVLIKLLFAVVLLIISTFIVLFITLSIDQKVAISSGEIIAQNPQSEFFVPFESIVTELRIEAGTKVLEGDTLAILQNKSVEFDFATIDKNVALQEQQIIGLQGQIAHLHHTIQQKEQQRKLYADKHQLNQNSAKLDRSSIQEQVNAKRQNVAILKKQVANSVKLLNNGGISKREYEALQQEYLEVSTAYSLLLKKLQQVDGQDAFLDNDYATTLSEFELTILQSKNKKRALSIQLNEERIRLAQLTEQLQYKETEIAKSFIIADKAGTIANLYNHKKEANFLQKGTLLLSIVPEESIGFYAKVALPQTTIQEVAVGQKAQLRLNAFSFMKYGIVNGELSFINKNEKNEFYALVDITEPNPLIQLKNGYEVQGDIIVKRVKLYQFAFNKLFSK